MPGCSLSANWLILLTIVSPAFISGACALVNWIFTLSVTSGFACLHHQPKTTGLSHLYCLVGLPWHTSPQRSVTTHYTTRSFINFCYQPGYWNHSGNCCKATLKLQTPHLVLINILFDAQHLWTWPECQISALFLKFKFDDIYYHIYSYLFF